MLVFRWMDLLCYYFLPMYNYQTYLQQQRIDQQYNQTLQNHQRSTIKRQRSMPTLIQGHKKRVEGFILTMIDKPHLVVPYKDSIPPFRQPQPSRHLSHSAFFLKRATQTERIEQAVKENSELDQVPFNNSSNHQFRSESAHANPSKPMRYKPVNRTLRIQEKLEKQTLNYLPNSPSQSVSKVITRAERKNPKAVEAVSRQVFKAMLPSLHQKTFFKSVHSLYTELPRQSSAVRTNERQQQEQEEGEVRRERKGVQHFSRRENSRQALVKCNMLKPLR